MKAVDYLKEKARMSNCPLNNVENMACVILESKYPEKAVEIVEKWAKENPVKTYLSVLLEKLPNTKTSIDGIPVFCVSVLFGGDIYCHKNNIRCVDCWNREYKESKDGN